MIEIKIQNQPLPCAEGPAPNAISELVKSL